MRIIKTKKALREAVAALRRQNLSIGLVPTMGFLHDGHLSLIKKARKENDSVIVSVFVNPTQFGPNEDLNAYPRDTERDIELIRTQGADIAFFPDSAEIYPEGYATYVEVQDPMTLTLCGRSRPGHFCGVTTVVSKLFHLTQPQRAYFGQKDAQQVAVIDKMARDLDFDIELVICPIVREPNGLAMSSRNTYLSTEQKRRASLLSQALFEAQGLIEQGERRAAALTRYIKERIGSDQETVIDYVSVVDAHSLADIEVLRGDVLIALAVKIGRTRLIDNIRIEV